MTTSVELHGFNGCPFAWRARLAAAFKGVPFEWLPCDAPDADERCRAHNPVKRSPLLYDDGFSLTGALIIAKYLDESRPGPALRPADAKERAISRLAMIEVERLDVPEDHEVTLEVRTKFEADLLVLERLLGDGRAYVSGANPGLLDVVVVPLLDTLAQSVLSIPASCTSTRAYWERISRNAAFLSTRS